MIALVLLLVTAVTATPFKDCGGRATDVLVDFNGCTEEPCQLVRGGTLSTHIEFTETETADSYHHKIYVIVAGIPIPFPVDNEDGCVNLETGDCPGEPGEKFSLTNESVMDNETPKVHLTFQWHILDNNDKDAVCIAIEADVVDASVASF